MAPFMWRDDGQMHQLNNLHSWPQLVAVQLCICFISERSADMLRSACMLWISGTCSISWGKLPS